MHRVADPGWADPLDVTHSVRSGGRWNPPGEFGVLYLNASIGVARANVDRLFAGLPYGPEDLDPVNAPILISLDVVVDDYVDAVSDQGLSALGLPATYPVDASGSVVPHSECQPIGKSAFDDGELGIACRLAAPGASGEEVAWFAQLGRPMPRKVRTSLFDEWYWPS